MPTCKGYDGAIAYIPKDPLQLCILKGHREWPSLSIGIPLLEPLQILKSMAIQICGCWPSTASEHNQNKVLLTSGGFLRPAEAVYDLPWSLQVPECRPELLKGNVLFSVKPVTFNCSSWHSEACRDCKGLHMASADLRKPTGCFLAKN